MKILAVCGSLQAKSSNLALLQAAAASAPSSVEFVLCDGLRDLPQFNPDIEAEWDTRERAAVEAGTRREPRRPDRVSRYGFSLPGALKNGIDWVIGSGELEGKVVAITAAVPGPERGRRGLQALRDTLSAVRATIIWGEPIAKGPEFAAQIATLVRVLIAAASAAAPPSMA